MTNEERNKVPQFTDVWVDIGVKDRKESETLVTPGDPVTYQLAYREIRNRLAVSPAMDDKVGLWAIMETLRLLRGRSLQAGVFFVSTVQEEVGLRGAITSTYGLQPTIGIAVDVCHATDTPGNDKKLVGETRLGAGPALFRGPNINPRVFAQLRQVAQEHEIPVQIKGAPRGTSTDANVMQLSREGVATGLVGLPNRYMHSPVEMVSLEDLERGARLLAEFCASVTPALDWTPQ
jgi:endoglucanase